MALQLFANFERTGESNIFYRDVSNVPFQCIVRLQDAEATYNQQLDLNKSFFARFSLDNGQTFTEFNLLTGLHLELSRSFVRTYPLEVYLYSVDDINLISPIQIFSLSAAFINQLPITRFIAYPGLVLDEVTGTLTQLTTANFTQSKGVYFYGEGHTEVIYLSAARPVSWFIGNKLNDLKDSIYKVYPTGNPHVSQVIFRTDSKQEDTIPITVCQSDPLIPVIPTAYRYDDITGRRRLYNFIASSLDVDGKENLNNSKFNESIKIKPYPPLSEIVFFSPFRSNVLTLPSNYDDQVFTASVSALAIRTAFFNQLTGTTWKLETTQDSFTKIGNWSYQTSLLPNIRSYQFPLSYEETFQEFPSILKVSPINETLLTVEVSCHKLIGLKKPPFDWKLREQVDIFKDTAFFLTRPTIKIYTPNYYNLLDQKNIDEKGNTFLGTKFFTDITPIGENYVVKDITITASNFSSSIFLTGSEITKPFYINFERTGIQSLTAVTTLTASNQSPEFIAENETTSVTNVFPNIAEALLEFDNTKEGTPYYKSEFTKLTLPVSSAPVLSPNEWAVEDNINNSIKLLYDSVDEIKRSLFRYKSNSFLYGWLGTNKFMWTDLECEPDSTAKLSWKENECPFFPEDQIYTAYSNDLSARCPNPITPRDIVVPRAPVVWEIRNSELSGIYNRSHGFGFNAYYYTRLDSKYVVASPNSWIPSQQRAVDNWEYFEILPNDQWKQIGRHPSRCPIILPPSAWTEPRDFENDLGVLFVLPQPPPTPTPLPAIPCGGAVNYSGGQIFPAVYTVNLGSHLGNVNLDYNAYSVPDRFVVEYNGLTAIDTGYRGDSSYQTDLNNILGSPTPITGPGQGSASFVKASTQPTATVKVFAPLPGTVWTFTLGCPERPPDLCLPPGATDVKVLSAQPSPDNPPSAGYRRWEACYRCVEIVVNSAGVITSSTQSGPTTNNLNLPQIVISNNLVPSIAGTYKYIFVFYGWRRWTPRGWISDDSKYDVWTDAATAALLFVGRGAAYVGFGASTGSFKSEQWVVDFEWVSAYNRVTMANLVNNSNYLGTVTAINSALRFTELSGGVGNVFYRTPVFITDRNNNLVDWSARYALSMGGQGSGGTYADGMTFIVQSNNLSAGGGGAGLGYGSAGGGSAIPNSFAVEYDTFDNGLPIDINNNHIGIDVAGSNQSVAVVTPPFSLWQPTPRSQGGGVTVYSWVDYNASTQTLSVFASQTNVKPLTAILTHVIDLRNHIVY